MLEVKYKCPACDAELPGGARFCPNCGFVIAENTGTLPPTAVVKETYVATTLDDGPLTSLTDETILAGGVPPSVVYVPRPTTVVQPSGSNALVITLVSLGMLAIVAVVVWNLGYLSHAAPGAAPNATPSSISIQNPPPATAPSSPNITLQNTPPTQQPATPPPATPPAAPPQNNPAITPPTAPPAATPPAAVPPVDVVSISAEATDTAATQWHYGFTLKLRNNTTSPHTVNLRIKFLDDQGYAVDDTLMNSVFVPANTEQDYQDYKLIDAATAAKVKSVKAELR